MSFFDNFSEDEKRKVFLVTTILGIVLLVCSFSKWFLWALTALLLGLSAWMAYKLFGSKTERKRLKEAFGLANEKVKGKGA